jgi:CheY-like chemotaxis protein/DNA-directed RNA polymerase subunit RPC12/RpoP
MTAKKEAVEITCSVCASSFRLWIPVDSLEEWDRGMRINCIRCGSEHLVKRDHEGFEVFAPSAAGHSAGTAGAAETAPAQTQASTPAEEKSTDAAEPSAAATDRTGMVLYIEDDRLSREMAVSTMKENGIDLLTARNSTEALMMLNTHEIILIVTDLYLKNPADPASQLDGEDFLKDLVDSGKHIPAIITTGKDIIDDLVLDPKWYDLHVKGFIQKGNPFWVEELRDKIKETLVKG